MSKKLIPFHWLPASWGLKGKTREIAQAEYELEGYELAAKLLLIKKDEFDKDQYERRAIELEYNYDRLSDSEYNRALANLIKDEKKKALALLELDHQEGKITDLQYQKESATLRNEPWVTIVNMDFSKGHSLEGSFELDWNDQWVEKLKADGYNGPTPDNIVNQWFMELSRNVAMEEFDGTGDFTADSAANLEAVKSWNGNTESLDKRRKSYK